MDMELVLHEGPTDATQICGKCHQGPPEVTMVVPGKCFPCHGTHCLCFGELPWSVAALHHLLFLFVVGASINNHNKPLSHAAVGPLQFSALRPFKSGNLMAMEVHDRLFLDFLGDIGYRL